MGNVTERAEALLSSRRIPFSKKVEGDWTCIRVDPAPRADFWFLIEDYSDGNANIGAHPVGADEDEYFFRLPYEPPDFDTAKALEDKVLSEFELLISNAVRIRRKRGLLLESFKAEVLLGSVVKEIHGASALRWGFRFHDPGAKEVEYNAPSLTAGAKGG